MSRVGRRTHFPSEEDGSSAYLCGYIPKGRTRYESNDIDEVDCERCLAVANKQRLERETEDEVSNTYMNRLGFTARRR